MGPKGLSIHTEWGPLAFDHGAGERGAWGRGESRGGLGGSVKQGAAHLPRWPRRKQPVLSPSCARAPDYARDWSGTGRWGGAQVLASCRLHRVRWLSLGAL